MHKIAIGLAAVFAVMVLIAVSLSTFNTVREENNEPKQPTRYSIPTGESVNQADTNKDTEDTSGLKTYTNTKYGYSFKYPENVLLDCGDETLAKEPKVCAYIWPSPDGPSHAPTMYVDVREPELFASRYKDTLNLSLKRYAEKVWERNKDEEESGGKRVTDIQEVGIAGRDGYQFTVTESYSTETDTESVDKKTRVIFIDNKEGVKLNIIFPSGDDTFEDILDTLTFI